MRGFIFSFTLFFTVLSQAQTSDSSFKGGEYLRYKLHYGLIDIGYSTVELKETIKDGIVAYHVDGHGITVGMASLFFKVKDNYQTYFRKDNGAPLHFIRRVNEGGYIISRDIYFDHNKGEAKVIDHKRKTTQTLEIGAVQDLVSTVYHLRNINTDTLKIGEEIKVKMFLDFETFTLVLKYKGKETIRSKVGKIRCKIYKPMVQAGRIFKENESLTMWISDDNNKIPIRIKASLAIGALKADLTEYRGLVNPFKFDN
ncbi:MAG: DUF3108 domain-containing protein [Flavobacteriaceae bacterium]|nr:DUF3108 domain-containing protein [Flavobacteriaceae bacterium]